VLAVSPNVPKMASSGTHIWATGILAQTPIRNWPAPSPLAVLRSKFIDSSVYIPFGDFPLGIVHFRMGTPGACCSHRYMLCNACVQVCLFFAMSQLSPPTAPNATPHDNVSCRPVCGRWSGTASPRQAKLLSAMQSSSHAIRLQRPSGYRGLDTQQ